MLQKAPFEKKNQSMDDNVMIAQFFPHKGMNRQVKFKD